VLTFYKRDRGSLYDGSGNAYSSPVQFYDYSNVPFLSFLYVVFRSSFEGDFHWCRTTDCTLMCSFWYS